MKRPSREKYERAVALARAAIRACEGRPRILADRSPKAVLTKMKAKDERGELLTEADQGALMAALAEVTTPKKRGRGRPKGKRAEGHRALWAAIWAVQESGLQPYRNNTGPRLSQCDAIADAMKAEGFQRLCSYDAARREMIAHRRGMKTLGRVSRVFAGQMQDVFRGISEQIERVRRSFDSMGSGSRGAIDSLQHQMNETARAVEGFGGLATRHFHLPEQGFAELAKRIRAQTTLPTGTRHAIKRAFKTRR